MDINQMPPMGAMPMPAPAQPVMGGMPGINPLLAKPGVGTEDTSYYQPDNLQGEAPKLFKQHEELDFDMKERVLDEEGASDDVTTRDDREHQRLQALQEQDPFGLQVEARLPERLRFLLQIADSGNVARLLTQDELDKIGGLVCREYEIDDTSRDDWKRQMEMAEKLFAQVDEAKNWPWPGAANVKYPLILNACIQFAARAYPEIIKGSEIVKVHVEGDDPDMQKQERANRIGRHMSFQLLEEIEEWEDGTDRLLHGLPLYGCYFRKCYYDSTLRRPRLVHLSPFDVVVNQCCTTINMARRITHPVEIHENEIWERIGSGEFLDVELGSTGNADNQDDTDAPHKFLEQDRYLDLDDDGYKEPYTVFVHQESRKVLGIYPRFDSHGIWIDDQRLEVLRIEPVHRYVKYPFIPDMKGSFYDLGFGLLLNPINDITNSTINQLLDAGTLQNAGGGFVARGARIKGGAIKLSPGIWQPIDASGPDLKNAFFPFPVNGPSPVLIQLLEMLIEAGKEMGNLSEVLAGESPGSNVPATTTLALIEQGMKVYSAIYKRVYRSLGEEFKILFGINARHLSDIAYYKFQDNQSAVARHDYAMGDLDVVPTADPSLATDIQRLARAQALLQIAGMAGMNVQAIQQEFISALKIENPERFIAPPQPPPPPQFIENKVRQDFLATASLEADVRDKAAAATLKMAQAKAIEEKLPIEKLQSELDAYSGVQQAALAMHQATQPQPQEGGGGGQGAPAPKAPPQAIQVPPDMMPQAAAQDMPMPLPPQAEDEAAAAQASGQVQQ